MSIKVITSENNDKYLILDENDIDNVNDQQRAEHNIRLKFNLNKHKRDGVHALKQDTIFSNSNDKKEKPEETNDNNIANYKLEIGSLFEFESRHNDMYVNQKELSNDVYDILLEKTDIDFSSNRRKPNKQMFNVYYMLLVKELRLKYTYSELFVELSFFFTDNIFNMFKLLDKDSATIIIRELKNKGFLNGLDTIRFV